MSVRRFLHDLLTPADVRRSALAGGEVSTMVPRPGNEKSKASANKDHLSRRETGYASCGDPVGNTPVDDGRCSPHDKIDLRLPYVEIDKQGLLEGHAYGYEGEVAVECTTSTDGRYPYRASLAKSSSFTLYRNRGNEV